MNIHRLYSIFFKYFRTRRMRRFDADLAPESETTILDVGGTLAFWKLTPSPAQVTVLNLTVHPEPDVPINMSLVEGNATELDFPSGSFDIGFSNSVIEHLGTYDQQQRFAAEISRVAVRLWVQTPAKWFPIEPHFIAPFIHYFPKWVQRRLFRNLTVRGWLTRPTRQEADALVNELRLLTYAEMKALFPDCEIRRERFLGLTKSYIAVRLSPPGR